MFYPSELLTWTGEVSSYFKHLSKSQVQMLAWYSFGASVVQGCGISQVVYYLSEVLGQGEGCLRQRLRESLYDAEDKRGRQRHAINIQLCFAPLLKWVLSYWQSEDQLLFLALDATTLRQTFTVLSVSVLVGRCAIPVAWKIVPATQAGEWQPHWKTLLQAMQGQTTPLRVMVLADRGLYAKWLFDEIVIWGWHPLLRINDQGYVCLYTTGQRLKLSQLAQLTKGKQWQGEVSCFLGERRLRCTLLVVWDTAQQEPWLLVTDLPSFQASPSWYALRMWIEAGFKFFKSATFHWERTRMRDPARAERLWLIIALAALRVALLAPPSVELPLGSYPRLSRFKRGLIRQLACLTLARPLYFHSLSFSELPPSPLLEFLNLLNTYP
jgi:hypothetical protein